jgi:hypothetical protein
MPASGRSGRYKTTEGTVKAGGNGENGKRVTGNDKEGIMTLEEMLRKAQQMMEKRFH